MLELLKKLLQDVNKAFSGPRESQNQYQPQVKCPQTHSSSTQATEVGIAQTPQQTLAKESKYTAGQPKQVAPIRSSVSATRKSKTQTQPPPHTQITVWIPPGKRPPAKATITYYPMHCRQILSQPIPGRLTATP